MLPIIAVLLVSKTDIDMQRKEKGNEMSQSTYKRDDDSKIEA